MTETQKQTKEGKMASLVKDFRENAEARLKELEPMVQEAEELKTTLAALNGKSETEAPQAPQRRGRGRQGKRAQELLDLVKAQPGITIPKAATEMGLKAPNYLYRIVGEMEESKKLRRQEDGGLVLV